MDSYPRKVRLREQKQINAENKRRGTAMERNIMKILKGNRVPFSGAGAIKGDGIVNHEIHGMYLVECKMSAGVDSVEPVMRLQKYWLDKLDTEVVNMRAKFGILVFHYHKDKSNYAMIRDSYFRKIIGDPSVYKLRELAVGVDGKKSFRIRKSVAKNLDDVLGVLDWNGTRYYIMDLKIFSSLLDKDLYEEGARIPSVATTQDPGREESLVAYGVVLGEGSSH